VPVDFVVLKMGVCRQIPLILGRPFLSTTEAMMDVAARIIKLNISRKEETSTFKPKGTEKCNQVKAQCSREFFYKIFSTRQEYYHGCDKIFSRTSELIFKGMETILLTYYKREALIGR
jgi:hypothetical protein